MSLRATLPAVSGNSGIVLPKVQLSQQLEAVSGAGLKHYINPVAAQLSDGIITCNDLTTGELIQSSKTPPILDTTINGKPSLTHGSGSAGIVGQILRANKVGALDLGTGAWSICLLVKAMGAGAIGQILGYVPGAKTTATSWGPCLRFRDSGSITLAPVLVANNLSAGRSFVATKEFYNTVRLLCLTHTPGVGMKWYIDNWSAPERTDVAAPAQAANTDGRFVIGSVNAGSSSFNFAGSWAVLTVHSVDLSLNNPARRDVMKAIAAYGGVTSN